MLNITESEWNGFQRLDFPFEGRNAIVVFADAPKEGNPWIMRTEYFGAFPAFDIVMLKRGYHLAYVSNMHRWGDPSDIEIKAHFCALLEQEYGFCAKCLPEGLSCGGMFATYFASAHPERVAALYIDAPVMNFLSCPCGVGDATNELYKEFHAATGKTVSELINYRNHPIDHAPKLLQANLPIMIVSGDCDTVVPYHENGAHLTDYYRKNGGTVHEIIKPGCDHHPHGLEDVTPLIEFTEKYYM